MGPLVSPWSHFASRWCALCFLFSNFVDSKKEFDRRVTSYVFLLDNPISRIHRVGCYTIWRFLKHAYVRFQSCFEQKIDCLVRLVHNEILGEAPSEIGLRYKRRNSHKKREKQKKPF